MSISRLVGPDMPAEVKQMFFSSLPLNEQFKAMVVCKEWAGHVDEVLKRALWNPNFEQFGLGDSSRVEPYENEEIKSAVLAYLQKYKELPDVITKLIDEDDKLMRQPDKDTQLALLMGDSAVSLLEFKKMLPIERMLHLMRGLRESSTELFIYLAKRHQKSYAAALKEVLHKSPGTTTHQYHSTDPCLSLILEYIKEPPGPFNASAVMAAICPFTRICSSQQMVGNICAEIVKSHCDLTIFFDSGIDLKSFGLASNSVRQFVHSELKPQMKRFNSDVTDDDWRACGLDLPQ